MSTFVGVVKEIPFIAVDYFNVARNPKPKIYFLSHFHTDHIKGLADDDFQEYLVNSKASIYASPITVSYLQVNYPKIKTKLQELEVGKQTFIKYDQGGEEKLLQVTTIPAGHCPGSVMFFFENDLNILCTGDFRLSANELAKIKCFKTDSNQTKKIHSVYLDSTFLSEEYKHFPTVQQSADALCELIRNWLDQNSAATVWISQSAHYGPECLLIEVSKRLGEKIHVPYFKSLYQCIPELDDVISTKSDNYKYRIHAFLKDNYCCPYPKYLALNIGISALLWKDYKPGEDPVLQNRNNAKVCASFHASYTEIEEFLHYLKPENVYLCVEPKHYGERNQMLMLLRNIMNKYKSKEESEPIMINKLRSDKFPKRTKSYNDLLDSPPRDFKAKRL